MAQIRNPNNRYSSSAQTKRDNLQLCLGMILGAILMFWYLGPTGILDGDGSDNTTTGNRVRRTSATANDANPEGDGWHPIHVFYGDRGSIPGLPKNKPNAEQEQQWFAQVQQDQVVLDLVGDNGYFIDLAANDAVQWTNTLALERHGWTGLCVEPNPVYWYGLSHRQCQVVGALVGGSVERVPVKFRGVFGGIVGKLDDKLANRKHEPQAKEELRYTVPFRDVLERFQVPTTIDYMSLDVEGAELLIMKEFPFDSYTIRIMTVERPDAKLRALLQEKGYRFLKDLAWWGETLWAHESTGLTPDHAKIQKIQTEERN